MEVEEEKENRRDMNIEDINRGSCSRKEEEHGSIGEMEEEIWKMRMGL